MWRRYLAYGRKENMPAPNAGEVPYSSIAGPADDRAEDEVNDVISPTMMLRIGKKGKRASHMFATAVNTPINVP